MSILNFWSGEETSGPAPVSFSAIIGAAKPYLAAILIVTILLGIWIGLRVA
jgi:hypothetical protein